MRARPRGFSIAASPPEPSPELLELRALLMAQQRTNQLLERLERLLTVGRGARDAADARLVLTIGPAAEWLPFKAHSVINRARSVPELAAALTGADITSAKQLGKLFARLEGVVIEGVRLERVPTPRGGSLWRVVHVSHI
jgi:hypothetical protein